MRRAPPDSHERDQADEHRDLIRDREPRV